MQYESESSIHFTDTSPIRISETLLLATSINLLLAVKLSPASATNSHSTQKKNMSLLSRPFSTTDDLLPLFVPIPQAKAFFNDIVQFDHTLLRTRDVILRPHDDLERYLSLHSSAAHAEIKLEDTCNPTAIFLPSPVQTFCAVMGEDFLDILRWWGACRSPLGKCKYRCWDRLAWIVEECRYWASMMIDRHSCPELEEAVVSPIVEAVEVSLSDPRAKVLMRLFLLMLVVALDVLAYEFMREALKESLLETLDLFSCVEKFEDLRREVEGWDRGSVGAEAQGRAEKQLGVVMENVISPIFEDFETLLIGHTATHHPSRQRHPPRPLERLHRPRQIQPQSHREILRQPTLQIPTPVLRCPRRRLALGEVEYPAKSHRDDVFRHLRRFQSQAR